MTRRLTRRVSGSFVLVAALAIGVHGCSSSGARPADAGSREQLALGLPVGTYLDSAVMPDGRYGESSKTVEEALNHLGATQKDGILRDSSGNEIHFETKLIRSSGAARKYPPSDVVIKLPD